MANNVFANGREVSCKSGQGKSICAFPDVCMTPPENPATPPGVPVPYPNTGFSSDCTSGSKTVKITNKEVMLKNKSYFKKSVGDEAGAAAKKGVVSSVNRGKVYFTAFSMDVKVEGENAVRHLDLTTHNHGSAMNTPPFPHIDSMTPAKYGKDPCSDEKEAIEKNCTDPETKKPYDRTALCEKAGMGQSVSLDEMDQASDVRLGSTYTTGADGLPNFLDQSGELPEGQRNDSRKQITAYERAQADSCLAARRCQLVSYTDGNGNDDSKACCPGQTPHHMIDDAYATTGGASSYEHADAPCVCVEGNSNTKGSHGLMHAKTKQYLLDNGYDAQKKTTFKYEDLRDNAAKSVTEVFPKSGCNENCLKAQVDTYFKKQEIGEGTDMEVNVQSGRGDDQRAAQIAWSESRQQHIAGGG
ncbi:MAG: PAAR-like domain-containing protein [Pseudomonadota bacterium]